METNHYSIKANTKNDVKTPVIQIEHHLQERFPDVCKRSSFNITHREEQVK